MRLNYNDRLKRLKTFKTENKKICFKSIKKNRILICSWWSRHKLGSLIKKYNNNRCLFTQRSRGIKKHFKVSRIELKRLVRSKSLSGVVLSSW